MQLGQAEAIGILDHHDRGRRHVYAHLNDGGSDQHIDFTGRKCSQRAFLFGGILRAVGQPKPQA